MLRLATVFSGIGAIEHALNRMNIDNEIIFACDNGNIDIFSKKIEVNLDQINIELNYLEDTINKIRFSKEDNYERQLVMMLSSIKTEYNEIIQKLKISKINLIENNVLFMLKEINNTSKLNKNRVKIYENLLNSLESEMTLSQKKLLLYQVILKIFNDFKRDNPLDYLINNNTSNLNSTYNIKWENIIESLHIAYSSFEKEKGKNIIRQVQTLTKQISQLYGKINAIHHLNNVKSLENFNDKKEYVDKLYKGNEKRNKVKISYMENYKCAPENYHWDVTFLDGTYYNNKVDLFVGGSPCQSFSIMGKQHGLSDTRGTLFYEYARLVEEIQPKVFIYENVRAVLTNDCGQTWEIMKDIFKQLGYNVYYTNEDNKPSVLNAKDYGIPQNRKRVFVVGFRSDLNLEKEFVFPKPLSLKYQMQDFLIENTPYGCFLPKKNVLIKSEKYAIDDESENNLDKYFLSEKIKKTILSGGTKNFYSNPEIDLKIARPLLNTMHKMHRAGEDNYVTTDGKVRRLTPRECLRLMGFSDDWKIIVSDTAMYQQAGNSIVVDVLINIIEEILKCYPDLVDN